jgi:hypothetical protein
MSESGLHRVVTANRLRDGVPVYFVGGGAWSPAIGDAVTVAAPEAAALLAAAQAGPAPSAVIAPYLVEVLEDDGGLRPLSLRERIRAFGPTA